jgi:diamine N-acetyltransferase
VLAVFVGELNKHSEGYDPAAIRRLIRNAFQDLGLLRLHLLVLTENQPAIKVYKKGGLVVDGTPRRHVYKNGQFKDVAFMGVCASDILSGGV